MAGKPFLARLGLTSISSIALAAGLPVSDSNTALKVELGSDPGSYTAASDADGLDTYLRAQSGGADAGSDPRGGDLVLIPGAAGSGGTGRAGQLEIRGLAYVSDTTASASPATGALVVGGGVGLGGAVNSAAGATFYTDRILLRRLTGANPAHDLVLWQSSAAGNGNVALQMYDTGGADPDTTNRCRFVTSTTVGGVSIKVNNPSGDMRLTVSTTDVWSMDREEMTFTPLWNNVATTFTGITINPTNTASAAASLLLDLQLSGATKFNVQKTGAISVGVGEVTSYVYFGTGSLNYISFNSSGYKVVGGITPSTTSAGAVEIGLGSIRAWGYVQGSRLMAFHGTITLDEQTIDSGVTWNNGLTSFTAWSLSVTDTASAASSLFLDFQLDGATKFSVRKDGDVTAGANTDRTFISGRCRIDSRTSDYVYISHYDLTATDNYGLMIEPAGACNVNAPTGQSVFLRVDHAVGMQLTAADPGAFTSGRVVTGAGHIWANGSIYSNGIIRSSDTYGWEIGNTSGQARIMHDGGTFTFYNTLDTLATVAAGTYQTSLISMANSQINETATDADDGALYLNNRGYAQGTTRFRDTYICDGKLGVVIGVDGSAGTATVIGSSPASHTTGSVEIGGGKIYTDDLFGSKIAMVGDDIYENATDTDNAYITVNYNGYAGGTTRFRDFGVYDGKNFLILGIDGSTAKTTFYGGVAFNSYQTIQITTGVSLAAGNVTQAKNTAAVEVTTGHASNQLRLWSSPATGDMIAVKNSDGSLQADVADSAGTSIAVLTAGQSGTFIYNGSSWILF